VFNIQPI